MSKIALEVAEAEFDRFVSLMEIDVDTDDMDEEEAKSFRGMKKKLMFAIQSGALTFAENGEPTYTPRRSEDQTPLTFKEPKGAAISVQRNKKASDASQMFAIMGDITGTHGNIFSKMVMKDLQVCTSITNLFLD